jgi:hypothetical protein
VTRATDDSPPDTEPPVAPVIEDKS